MGRVKLIFAEIHDDISTMRILNAIIPELKKLGYEIFLEELPAKLSIEKLMVECELGLRFFSLFPPDDSTAIAKMNNGKMWLQMLSTLKEEQISVKAIDPLEPTEPLTGKEYEDLLPMRDKAMATEYLKSTSSFGRMGLAHLPGVQAHIIAEIGSEEAAARSFRFFHIYGGGSLQVENKSLLNGLPIRPLMLDVKSLSDKQIIEQIIREIGLNQDEIFNPKPS